jgi:hypothetical protein
LRSFPIRKKADLPRGSRTSRLRRGRTEEAAIDDLKLAIRGYIDTFGLDDALSRIAPPKLKTIDLDLMDLARD